MDDDFKTGIRNRIAGLCLVPIVSLVVLLALSAQSLSGEALQPVFVVVSAAAALLTGLAGWFTLRSLNAMGADIRQSAEIMARRELAPARWDESHRTTPQQEQPELRQVPLPPSVEGLTNGRPQSRPTYDQHDPYSVVSSQHQDNDTYSHQANTAIEESVDQQVVSDSAHLSSAPDVEHLPMTSVVRNLVKRIQAMLDRQIDLVDELESKEEDPAYLEKLFKIDHLANRMRRNADGLLVLSGAEVEQRIGGPVSILDVLRVSIGEVEAHQRVDLVSANESWVTSASALPLAHMVAELIENAIEFSPPSSTVKMIGRGQQGRDKSAVYEILIADSGIGMTEGQLAEANRQLSEPIDLAELSGYAIGMSVVGRLARSLGVSVTLSSNPNQGTTASIRLPSRILADAVPVVDPGQRSVDSDDALPVLQGLGSAELAQQSERHSRAGLPILDRESAESRSEVDSQLPSTQPERFPQPPRPNSGPTDAPPPSRPSHRKPGEIEQMMRRFRKGQSGVRPTTNGVDDE